MAIEELESIIVHSNEALAVTYNPSTHAVTITELPDGNKMLEIRPIDC